MNDWNTEGWPGCQYRFGIWGGRSVIISAISFNWTGCGTGGCCMGECGGGKSGEGWLSANRCGSGKCVWNYFAFAEMSERSRLIICLASTCSYVGKQALYTGIRARRSPSFFVERGSPRYVWRPRWLSYLRGVSRRLLIKLCIWDEWTQMRKPQINKLNIIIIHLDYLKWMEINKNVW